MPNIIDTYKQYYAKDRKAWRSWLEKNHAKSPGIWLIYYKKESGKPRLAYADAVEEALCFGWIDSTVRSIDEDRYMQLFTQRKPQSGWSKLNKDRVQKLIDEGLMAPAGIKKIDLAKQNGTWDKLDSVELLTMPPELKKALGLPANKKAKGFFDKVLAPSQKKQVLYWIGSAKLPATREKRIAAFIETASEHKLPSHFARNR